MHPLLRRFSRSTCFGIVIGSMALFGLSMLIVPSSVTSSAIISMLPYVAILCVASLGQMLAFLQRGIDLSIAGTISLTGVFMTRFPANNDQLIIFGLGLTLGTAMLVGAINGWLIAYVRINPLIATLGIGTLLECALRIISGGQAYGTTPPAVEAFGAGRTLGISNLAWVALIIAILLGILLTKYKAGRWLAASGANPLATRALGTRQRMIVVASYTMSSLLFAFAGILMTAFFVTPGLTQGTNYIFPSIAATVIGGTSVAGGVATVFGTLLGALFIEQLSTTAFIMIKGTTQSTTAIQFVVSGVVIAIGMALRNVEFTKLGNRLNRWSSRIFSSTFHFKTEDHGS